MKHQDFLWIFPFASFCIGYLFLALISSHKTIIVPCLIGKNSTYAAKILSMHTLNFRIITTKEDPDLPDGTILSQNPGAGHTVKANQAIYCVLSQKPQAPIAPNLLNQNSEQIATISQHEGLRIKKIFLESSYPAGMCIGQIPQAGTALEQKILLVYISKNNNKVLFPNLLGGLVTEVIEFLQPFGLNPTIAHRTHSEPEHHCKLCRIINQKPLAGSLVDLSKPLNIQVQVR